MLDIAQHLPFSFQAAFRAIEERIGSKFNVALIDCEGCLANVANTGLLAQIRLILMEEDNPAHTNYTEWYQRLRAEGFRPRVTRDAFTNHLWTHTWIPGASKVSMVETYALE